MNKFFTLLTLLISFANFAQITITSGDFQSGGDTAMVSVSDSFDFDYEATGDDYTWDFTTVNRTAQRIDTFFAVTSASVTYQVVFNNAFFDPDYKSEYYRSLSGGSLPSPPEGLGISFDNPVAFTKIESGFVENVGIGVEMSGVEVPVKAESRDRMYELPLNNGDSWVSNSFLEIDLNPAYDGTFKRYQSRSSEVDGYGEISTPFGTFEVIRVKSVLDYTDSINVTLGGGIPVVMELPTPDEVHYTWLAKEQKIPVFNVVAQVTGGSATVTSVEYKDSFRGYAGLNELTTDEEKVMFYPNPAQNTLTVVPQGNYNALTIFTMDGKKVKTTKLNTAAQVIDVSSFVSGMYIVELTGQNETYIQQLIIE